MVTTRGTEKPTGKSRRDLARQEQVEVNQVGVLEMPANLLLFLRHPNGNSERLVNGAHRSVVVGDHELVVEASPPVSQQQFEQPLSPERIEPADEVANAHGNAPLPAFDILLSRSGYLTPAPCVRSALG